jgi:hypothetical protein
MSANRAVRRLAGVIDVPLAHLGTVNKGRTFTIRYGGKAPSSSVSRCIMTSLVWLEKEYLCKIDIHDRAMMLVLEAGELKVDTVKHVFEVLSI